ncbi:F-box protein CPR1-like [Papaver somniferum]|uniref:F-box protein CPR1-like n=1 Tax=Papaver somniferum TaxID=3469 RepID=UPI000E6FD796|nr:F-box protein CPR1-like [Papaver somniferum]
MLRLPEEIQVDVFLRLPAKSILRCRCVCKPLCRLLYNPKFIKDHLNHNKKNPNLMLIFNQCYRPPECCSIDNASILSASSASALSTKCTCDGGIRKYNCHQSEWAEGVRIVGSCNGLICININGGPRFCIWNPSTEEYSHLSLFHFSSSSLTFGFGYDCHLDVYKLMRIVADDPGNCYNCYIQVQVCTLRGNMSWKTIQTMNRYYFFPEGPTGHLAVWFLNGALHWKGFIMPTL